MKVFLEEAEEQLQLLDEEVIRLEKETSEEGLATIFRAAHTLKGSSAMIGYRAMTEVAHAMESMLDKLRNHVIVVTPVVVDSLLHSMDALRVLNEELADPAGIEVDFESLVKEMDTAVAAQTGDGGDQGDEVEVDQSLDLSDTVLAEVNAQLESNRIVYQVQADLEEGSAFGAVRFFQLHSELSEFGKIITSTPSEADIAAEKIARRIPERLHKYMVSKVPAGARPHHSFHVLDVCMRTGALADQVEILDRCRISWGVVQGVSGDAVTVRYEPVVLQAGKLVMGRPSVRETRRAAEGLSYLKDLQPGEIVSMHWGWVCDRLTPAQVSRLSAETSHHIRIANETL